jgi:hypothetical protein
VQHVVEPRPFPHRRRASRGRAAAARRSPHRPIHRRQSVAGKPNRRSPLLVCVVEPYLAAGEPVPAVGPEGGRPEGIFVKISTVLRSPA